MAHGLETRVPFLDNDLVDFAAKLPLAMKLGNLDEVVRLNENEPGPKTRKYFQKTKDGKIAFRNVMRNYISANITNGIKQGFSAPDSSWFKGESIEYVRKLIFNKHASIYDFFDPNIVQTLVKEHINGDKNRRLLIWSLLNFECWLQEYFS
jgi:asparagine synthase (glutamine-hydrolysing)